MFTLFRARARSLATALSTATFVPGASRSSYIVITGPDSTPTTSPSILYSLSARSKASACSRT
jgi:hypothetical protein